MRGKKSGTSVFPKYIPAKFGSVQLHAEHSISVSGILPEDTERPLSIGHSKSLRNIPVAFWKILFPAISLSPFAAIHPTGASVFRTQDHLG